MLVRSLVCFFAVSVAWAEIADATVEQTGVHRYHIAFRMGPADARVSIFASHSPDQPEDAKPITATSDSAADIHLHGWTGRAYFHLKTADGQTRAVSIRRLPLEGQNNFRDLGGYRWGRLYRSR
ncbi:MAG: tyrosine-protein phosphatase [Acidobacteriia bacterium]|nr:tyrosine-protein phosphatase [Terriglobia bacterium]